MRILNDHKGDINGDVRFESFQDLDIIVIALNELSKNEAETSFEKYKKEYAKKLSKQLFTVANALADKYARDTYYQEPKV